MIEQIYCDLDGVLADFDKKVKEIFNGDFPQSNNKLWRGINPLIEKGEFWNEFDPMPDAFKLWNYIKGYEPIILTAGGDFLKERTAKQKKEWCKRVLGWGDVIVTVNSADKARYASPKNILIDDRSQSIDPWVAAGGIGILHTSAADTIKKLKKYGL